jgi:outer membrane biosynthesis protein TonB
MSDIGGMPRRVLVYSAIFHVAVAGTLFGLYHFHLFDRDIAEDAPLVVQLVNAAPQTRATEVNRTPPKPEKPPEVAQVEPPKPEPPKPEPPKPEPPKPEPPPQPEPKPPPPPPPDAKPEVKAEAPKPPPPKPEPPKKKDDDAAFDAYLKNLAKRDPARLQDKPQQQAVAEPRASSQPNAPLGPQLTTSEIDLVKQQIARCWNVPAGARDAKDLRPEFRVYMNPDATVRSATQLNPDRNSDPFFRAAAESAMRALRNPQCQPLKLPPQKYDLWQTFTITFDPKDLL